MTTSNSPTKVSAAQARLDAEDAFICREALRFIASRGRNVASGACRAVRSEAMLDWLHDAVLLDGLADITTAAHEAKLYLDGFRSAVRAQLTRDEAADDESERDRDRDGNVVDDEADTLPAPGFSASDFDGKAA